MKNKKKLLLDANILVSMINSQDDNHIACYSFYQDHVDQYIFYVPSLAYFEFQAAQSRFKRKHNKQSAYREVYMENVKKYDITYQLIKRCWNLDLFNKYDKLKGADLVYACISKVENIPLATNDTDFKSVENDVEIIWIN